VRIALASALLAGLIVPAQAGQAVPDRLSETGLYLPGTTAVDPRNRPFSPQYPLWTDGAAKSRWLRLPQGTRIDARNIDGWIFPVGTRLWKEFSFGGRKVETRMIWRSSTDAWSYATYVWNDAQTDATLVPAEGLRGVAEIAPGKRHAIPSREDCRTCHENGTATPVLGFTALQLSTDRDPAAPHADALAPGMLTVRALVDEQLLDPPRPELATNPPRIPGGPRTRAVLGYLTGNCGHCHNERSTIATVRYPMQVPAYASHDEVRRMVDVLRTRPTAWEVPHAQPGTTTMVADGSPDRSALFVRMRSRQPSSQMPPLGSVVADRQALELIASWIQE
jgi:hypothetical protein